MKIDKALYIILLTVLALSGCKKKEIPPLHERYDLEDEILSLSTNVYNVTGTKLSFYTDVILIDDEEVLSDHPIGVFDFDPLLIDFNNNSGTYSFQFDSVETYSGSPTNYSAVLMLAKGEDQEISGTPEGLNYYLQHLETSSEIAICTYKKETGGNVELNFYGDELMEMPVDNSDFLYEAYQENKSGEDCTLDAIYDGIDYISANAKFDQKYIICYFNELPEDTSYHSLTEVFDHAIANNVHLIMMPRYDDDDIAYELGIKTGGAFVRYGDKSVEFSLNKILSGNTVTTRIYFTITKDVNWWATGWFAHAFDYEGMRVYYKFWY